ncbi:MAG: hypothetical protein H0U06_10230, partial [Solirubrobacterales bacterium]|nr:hypothetical protein [Solirubrobacterales bacterium]
LELRAQLLALALALDKRDTRSGQSGARPQRNKRREKRPSQANQRTRCHPEPPGDQSLRKHSLACRASSSHS